MITRRQTFAAILAPVLWPLRKLFSADRPSMQPRMFVSDWYDAPVPTITSLLNLDASEGTIVSFRADGDARISKTNPEYTFRVISE